MKAVFNGEVVAESDDTVVVEGNHYFPRESVKMEFLKKNGETYQCHWKGEADYYDVTVGGETANNGAFVYEQPSDAAAKIKGRFAFWQSVEVKD